MCAPAGQPAEFQYVSGTRSVGREISSIDKSAVLSAGTREEWSKTQLTQPEQSAEKVEGEPAAATQKVVNELQAIQTPREVQDALGGRLLITRGRPQEVIPQVCSAVEATAVHVSADFSPFGVRRDAEVTAALAAADVPMIATGSPT